MPDSAVSTGGAVMSKAIEGERIFQTLDKVAKESLASNAQKVADGYANFAEKLGVVPKGGDLVKNTISDGTYIFNLVTRNRILLEAAYRGSWVVGRVVDSIAEDMTRAGVNINTSEGADELQEFQVNFSRLQIWQSLCDAIKWGRLYGGAVAVLQIDGQDLATPLNLDRVGKGQFKGLVVYDRWQLWPVLSSLIEVGPEMGLPSYYDIILGANLNDPSKLPGGQEATQTNSRVRVHHSRCVRLGGHKLPFFQAITEMMWDESILERLWDRLIEFDNASTSAGQLVSRANLRTVGIENLRNILAAGGEEEQALIEQFEYMRQFQNNEGLTLLDKEDVFASTAYSFAGLSDVILQFGQQLSGSCEIPLVRLFGQSPTGLNSSGDSDLRTYYDGVMAKQEAQLRNPIEKIIKVMWRSMTGQAIPNDLTFTFKPLWQMSAVDKSAVATANTNSIIAAHQEGLVKTSTAMKELKQCSGESGVFSQITDEEIEEAEAELPPSPETGENEESENLGEEKNETGKEKITGELTGDPGSGPTRPKAKDSAWSRFKKLVKGRGNDSFTLEDIVNAGDPIDMYAVSRFDKPKKKTTDQEISADQKKIQAYLKKHGAL